MFELRRATVNDVPIILRLVRELAEYEREPEAVVATEADVVRDGFGERPLFEVLLADAVSEGRTERQPVGFALYFLQYSTWTGRPVLYLEDLFVQPSHRKLGIGKAFMKRLAKEAVDRQCMRFQWAVLDWNAPSIAFYESLGAKIMLGWLTARVDGEALERLANDAREMVRGSTPR
jgi:GNAT superfamily N-acetyltransferase